MVWRSSAQRRVLHGPSQALKQLDVAFLAAAFADVRQDGAHLAQAFAARRAFSAAFLAQEIDVIPRHFHHARTVVHDDHAAGSHHGAVFGQRVEVHRQVEQGFRNAAAGRSAGLHRLERTVACDAAADVEDELAQRGAHRHLYQAGMLDFAHHSKDLRALGALRA